MPRSAFQRPVAQTGNIAILALASGMVAWAGLGMELGTPRRLGPGAFPLLAGLCLMALSLASILIDLRRAAETTPGTLRADPLALLAVCGAMAAFAITTGLAGVLPGVALTAFIATLPAREMRLPARLLFALGTALVVWVVFFKLLGVPFIAIRGVL
ncbi:tripartite tricarboxylate transporter TctB family protein [Pseudogemmobacter sonorensis]|uniref:tripartite tricarboxylate transporter TctB family protein n=1 Tax=Pseudogemmobacter sonorensis TaxID=2989681 RepID=UPI0036894361